MVRPLAGQGSHGCMVVIFGFGAGSPEDLGEVVACTCPNCHNQVFLHHVRSKKSVRLYFVPVVPYGTDDYLVCPVCSRGLQLNRTQVRYLTRMAGATASFRAGRLGPGQYQARVEQFWRQLGMTPGGRVNPAGAAAPASAPPPGSAPPPAPAPAAVEAQPPWLAQLHHLGELHDQGVLSDAAFAAAKQRLLDQT